MAFHHGSSTSLTNTENDKFRGEIELEFHKFESKFQIPKMYIYPEQKKCSEQMFHYMIVENNNECILLSSNILKKSFSLYLGKLLNLLFNLI